MSVIAERGEVDEQDVIFRVRDTSEGDIREAFLVTDSDGEVHAWLNYCQHITTVSLHDGDELPRRGDQILCRNHGAMFNADDGVCTFGPCEGAQLERLAVEVEHGDVVLADEEYAFIGRGGVEDDGLPDSTVGEGF